MADGLPLSQHDLQSLRPKGRVHPTVPELHLAPPTATRLPRGKRFRSTNHALDQQSVEKLALEPCLRTPGILLRQMTPSQNGFHAFENQFDLPTQTVELQNGGGAESLRQRRLDQEVLGEFQRLGRKVSWVRLGPSAETARDQCVASELRCKAISRPAIPDGLRTGLSSSWGLSFSGHAKTTTAPGLGLEQRHSVTIQATLRHHPEL